MDKRLARRSRASSGLGGFPRRRAAENGPPHWTHGAALPIWREMGHRLLAAMLALLASLAAQIAPAQARVPDGGRTEIGAVETLAELSVQACSHVAAHPAFTPGAHWPAAATTDFTALRSAGGAVAVGVDRALE